MAYSKSSRFLKIKYARVHKSEITDICMYRSAGCMIAFGVRSYIHMTYDRYVHIGENRRRGGAQQRPIPTYLLVMYGG